MYIPPAFAEQRTEVLHDFIEQHSFATLTTANPLAACHMALLLERDHGPFGRLAGHLAKANPQAASDGQPVLAIFTGPHTYISPAWYEEENVVPTWNYTAVHATGVYREMKDEDAVYDLLARYVQTYEANRETPWQLPEDQTFIRKMSRMITAFTIEIETLQGAWKLSQHHPPLRRTRVINALEQQPGEDAAAIAAMMKATARPDRADVDE